MIFETGKIVLCSQKKGCCPTVYYTEDGSIKVTDDFGGSVKLTQDEFYMMERAVKHHKKEAKKNSLAE